MKHRANHANNESYHSHVGYLGENSINLNYQEETNIHNNCQLPSAQPTLSIPHLNPQLTCTLIDKIIKEDESVQSECSDSTDQNENIEFICPNCDPNLRAINQNYHDNFTSHLEVEKECTPVKNSLINETKCQTERNDEHRNKINSVLIQNKLRCLETAHGENDRSELSVHSARVNDEVRLHKGTNLLQETDILQFINKSRQLRVQYFQKFKASNTHNNIPYPKIPTEQINNSFQNILYPILQKNALNEPHSEPKNAKIIKESPKPPNKLENKFVLSEKKPNSSFQSLRRASSKHSSPLIRHMSKYILKKQKQPNQTKITPMKSRRTLTNTNIAPENTNKVTKAEMKLLNQRAYQQLPEVKIKEENEKRKKDLLMRIKAASKYDLQRRQKLKLISSKMQEPTH